MADLADVQLQLGSVSVTSTEDKIAVWYYKRQEKDLYRFLIRCS